MRQSHLSYYYPTRASLLVAVARRVVEAQLALTASMLNGASASAAASSIAKVVSRPESARVLLMLVSASDEVPEVRELFQELAAGMVEQGQSLLSSLGAEQTTRGANIVHALSVGLAVIGFATGRPDGEARAKATLKTTIDLLCKGGIK
jgi:BetI-type transcriptional repressor, C-terminal